MTRRKLPVDLEELITALDARPMEAHYYLDLETGDVILVSDEASGLAEEIVENIPEDQEVTREALEAVLEERDEQDWMLEDAVQAALVDQGLGTRYVEVPAIESHEAYRDMETFIDTVADLRLQGALERAIDGRHPFRRFKDVLLDHPDERQRWFTFQDDIVRRRVLDWLDAMDIEPLPRSNVPRRT